MKVRVEEQTPGELDARAVDVVRVLERLTGQDLLKAEEGTPAAKWDIPATRGSYERRAVAVERIRRMMLDKLSSVLE